MKFICLISLLFIIYQLPAQNEANNWYFGFHVGLSFNDDTVKVLSDGKLHTHEGSASYSDAKGNLLLYTDGDTVWNKHHQVIAAGLGACLSTQQATLILPAPGSDTKYYVLSNDCRENQNQSGLNYSIIDLSYHNGNGGVFEKNVNIHKPGTEALSAVGKCGCLSKKEYWIAAAKVDEPGKIFTYFLDENGIKPNPVISSYQVNGTMRYIKFSPDGKKAAFIYQSADQTIGIMMADFDFTTGKLHNFQQINPEKDSRTGYSSLEFSPNGKILYYKIGPSFYQVNIDAEYFHTIYQRDGFSFAGNLQLAPNGKIYYPNGGLGVINHPNLYGEAIDINHSGIDVGAHISHGMPGFVTSLLYQDLHARAGKDTLLCSGQTYRLGPDTVLSEATYFWKSAEYLDNPGIPNPEFSFINPSDTIRNFRIFLTVADENCSQCDTVNIAVLPKQDENIQGTFSVCPGVEGVSYRIKENSAYNYQWEIEGGIITAGQNTPTVTVDWGPTNANAWLKVFAIPEYGKCDTIAIHQPVRINVELQSGKPEGLENICFNLTDHNTYRIAYTNGSTYQWGVYNGKIDAGQGTNEIIVNWIDSQKQGKIWVEEENITKDTICYGVSDTLYVNFYQDTTSLEIRLVSIDKSDPDKVLITHRNKSSAFKGNPEIYRSDGDTWILLDEIKEFSYFDTLVDVHNKSYDYELTGLSPCQNLIRSEPHNTILLNHQLNEYLLTLNWNKYQAWDDSSYDFEIWKKTGSDDTLNLVQTISSNQQNYQFERLKAGHGNQFRIAAFNHCKDLRSWSNQIVVDLKYPVFIPNVITPNNDGRNDTFVIEQIESYPDNQLTIYNRFGQLVFQTVGYENDWDGGKHPPGIYYYHLRLDEIAEDFKGWLQILN